MQAWEHQVRRAAARSFAAAPHRYRPGIAPPPFVSFEGVDGAGKTTQARLYADWLRARGLEVVELREPGGTHVGERVRELVLLDLDARICPRSEALLFAAARAQAVDEIIAPALARGAHVVADRFVDSSLVYQGSVRELGVDAVRDVNDFAMAGVLPDRTVVLELPAREAQRAARGPAGRSHRGRGARLPGARGRGLRGARRGRARRGSCGWSPRAIRTRSPLRVREAIGGD